MDKNNGRNDYLNLHEKDSIYEKGSSGFGCLYLMIIGIGILWGLGSSIGQKREKELVGTEFHKKELSDFVDTDKNGLSFGERYELRKLMNVQDSSNLYIPTERDWKVGYWNMLKAQGKVEKR